MEKERLDVLMVNRGLSESRARAQRLVMAGQVRVEGQVQLKPSAKVSLEANIAIETPPQYVSRGGEKLEAAFRVFPLDVEGSVCADVGASTGGFTDCLLQHGAGRIYAIDVGYGILHWKIRNNPKVVSLERTNARHLDQLPEPVMFISIDASFISLRLLLPVVKKWFPSDGGKLVALIKPQFEAGKEAVDRGEGVIHDPTIHRQVLNGVLDFAEQEGYGVRGLIRSPLLGPKGNAEFLAYLIYPGGPTVDIETLIGQVME